MDWPLIVPGAAELKQTDLSLAREVRLRPGQPITARLPGGWWRGRHILTPEEISRAAQALSGHSLAAHQKELRNGFLPLPGGHRLGVAGRMDENGVRQIVSLCVRVCHEIPGAGGDVFPRIEGRSTLIVGPPGSGKTTLLRDLIRLYGLAGRQVGLCDERGEIAACADGQPQLDIGPCCDVISGIGKEKGLPLLIRALAPEVAAVDEVGGSGDAAALHEALRCGVILLATLHGGGPEDIARRSGLRKIVPCFERFVLLRHPGTQAEILTVREVMGCSRSWR